MYTYVHQLLAVTHICTYVHLANLAFPKQVTYGELMGTYGELTGNLWELMGNLWNLEMRSFCKVVLLARSFPLLARLPTAMSAEVRAIKARIGAARFSD